MGERWHPDRAVEYIAKDQYARSGASGIFFDVVDDEVFHLRKKFPIPQSLPRSFKKAKLNLANRVRGPDLKRYLAEFDPLQRAFSPWRK